MADPQTANIGFYQPPRGTDPGTWDLPVNANSGTDDSLWSNTSIISLSNANVTLSVAPNSGAAWSGPYQAQSALIRLTGVISASIQAILPRPGFFIFENLCTIASGIGAGTTAASFFVQVAGGLGAGKVIGLPYGKKQHIYYDGTDVDFINMPDPGTAYDLHGATAVPSWMTACTVLPYLIKNGANFPIGTYPALFSYLGNQFGGTPGLNFNLPNELARARIAFDTGGTNRLTSAISGVNGATMGSAGGNQSMQQHNHGATSTVIDPGHFHDTNLGQAVYLTSGGRSAPLSGTPGQLTTFAVTGITVSTSISLTGGGNSQNVQPSIVSFLPLIKTAILVGFLVAASNMLPSKASASLIDGTIAAPKITSQLSACPSLIEKVANLFYFFRDLSGAI